MGYAPPWAQAALLRHLPEIRQDFPESCQPVLTYEDEWGLAPDPNRKKRLLVLGCGHYGCVVQTQNERIVLKITSDSTEAHFVGTVLNNKWFSDGVVKYYAVRMTDDKFRKRNIYFIWREEAEDVGSAEGSREFFSALSLFQSAANKVRQILKRASDPRKTLTEAKRYEDWAFRTVGVKEPDYYAPASWQGQARVQARSKYNYPSYVKSGQALAAHLRACELATELMENESEGYLVGQALSFYQENGLLLADVHTGNLGMVEREDYTRPITVITDPGHSVLLKPELNTITISMFK